jgi:arylsulfatase A-like enzyme
LINWRLHTPESLSPDDLASEVAAYDGAIAYTDDQIGALLDALAVARPDRPRLVIVTSDHGEEFGEHRGFLHGNHLYQETIHVPLIVSEPGAVPAGQRISTPVTNTSVAATILERTGLSAEPALSPSLRTLWEAPAADGAWPLPLAELEHRPWVPEGAPVRDGALRSLYGPGWQYIEHDTRVPEFYDLLTDPREQQNVAGRPEVAGRIPGLAAEVRRQTRP